MQKRSLSRITVRRKPGDFTPRLAHRRSAGAAGGARPRRHQGQQARRRRRHAARQFPAHAAMVARRQASASAPRRCRCNGLTPADGWCEDPTDRHYNRPVKVSARMRVPTGWRARTISTISSSRLTTTRGRALPAAAARSSSTRRGKASPRPPAASRSSSIRFAGCSLASAPAPELSSNKRYYFRSPKIALPTRTWVAPSAIAVAKSALIPIDSNFKPLRFAILAVSAKCGPGASSSGGMHISPEIVVRISRYKPQGMHRLPAAARPLFAVRRRY